jgi:hypothetical protein
MSWDVKEIANFPSEYKEMMKGLLTKRQLEILDGDPLKSSEGMIFGRMYADWKDKKGYKVDKTERNKDDEVD